MINKTARMVHNRALAAKAYETAVQRGQYANPLPTDERGRRASLAARVKDECIEAEFAVTADDWLEELADVVICAFSVARHEGLDLAAMIEYKMDFNERRIGNDNHSVHD